MNKKYLSFFSYLNSHRLLIAVIVLFSLIQTVFATISFLIIPDIIFSLDPDASQQVVPIGQTNLLDYVSIFKQWLAKLTENLPYLDRVITMAVIVILVYLAKNIIDYIRRVLTAWFEISVVTEMRKDVFTHIQNLSLSDHSKKEKGHYLSLLTRDITQVFISMKRVFEHLLTQPLLIINLLMSILFISWKLSVLIILAVPVTGLLLTIIGKSLRRKSQRVMKQGDDYLNVLNESFNGFKIFKSFNAEKFQENRFEKEINKLKRLTFLQSVVQSINIPLTEIMGATVVAGVLALGAYISVSGEGLNGKDIVTILIGLIAMIEPIKKIGEVYNELKVAMVSVDRVFDILQLAPDENQFGDIEHPQFESKIEFNIDEFKYTDDARFALKDIRFEINKGETVALVGASGCGKSTLADLLARFHQISKGSITIDGIDIREISNRSLRNLVSIVPQQAFLLNDSIQTNIRFNQENSN
ncbi:MAG: ABC transporter ATP-binding protein, partial [Calditrichaeota bacterium]|nr:ABC transporter ATP-binding protein [Calditrichota bacterium]